METPSRLFPNFYEDEIRENCEKKRVNLCTRNDGLVVNRVNKYSKGDVNWIFGRKVL